MNDDLVLFALNGTRELGERIGRELGLALAPHEERDFEDGEHKARPLTSVRGKDVFIIHSLYGDRERSGNDKLCRLLFFIGALKDGGAARATAVVPYLAYARKDRKTKPRDPVATRYVAQLFEAVGTDALITIDVHELAAFQNAFRCPTENLEAATLFLEAFLPMIGGADIAVVSPDAGGAKRAERFRRILASRLGKPVGGAFAEKYRSDGTVSGGLIVGEVRDRDVIIIDDMISTGTTMTRAARACRAAGARRVFAAATHGLFAGGADAALADDAVEAIVVTDTVPPFRLETEAAKAKLSMASCAALFAEVIFSMHGGNGADIQSQLE
jgi:ribose-phosphate pyrophosphokinase